jgi:hypothetical protein
MRRWLAPLGIVLCLVSACVPASAIAGDAVPANVVGVTQTSTVDGALDVTPLALVDPAPVYKESEYGSEPEEGTRLVAIQFKVTNSASEDQLIGPVGRVRFHTSDGRTLDDSLIKTSAGAMLDQLRMAPKQTMIGYLTAEIPDGVTVTSVDFKTDSITAKQVLTWDTTGQEVKEPLKLPARTGEGPKTEKAGVERVVEGSYQADEYRLTIAATTMTDPAETDDPEIRIGPDRRLLRIDFTVHNDGKIPYSDVQSDADLRTFAVQNEEDEAYTSHVYGATEEHGMPLMPGDEDTWHVLFEVPTDFVVDRVSFSPSFGHKVATVWTM